MTRRVLTRKCSESKGYPQVRTGSSSIQCTSPSVTTTQLEVVYADVGGGVQVASVEFSWPLSGTFVSGTVTDGSGSPLQGVMVDAIDTSSMAFAGSATTDLNGDYQLILDPGTYDVSLSMLPSNAVPPAPVEVVIDESLGAFTVYFDGIESIDQTLDFTVESSVAGLSGVITVDGVMQSAQVIAFVGGQEVSFFDSFDGNYTLFLPAGDVVVVALVPGLSPSILLPAPFTQTLTDTGSLQSLSHDFAFVTADATNPGTTVYGAAYSNGAPFMCEVVIEDSSGALMSLLQTDTLGYWSATLAAGTYTFSIADGTLPAGFSGSTDAEVLVDATGFSGASVFDNTVVLQANTEGTLLSGTVTDSSAAPVQGVTLRFVAFDPMSPFGGVTTAADGTYSILIPEGDYQVEVDLGSLPAGVVTPPSVDLQVGGATQTYDLQLQDVDANITGTVTLDGVGIEAEVIVLDDTSSPVSFTTTAADGTYSIGLLDGGYTVVAELETESVQNVVTPDSVDVTLVGSDQVADFAFVTATGGNSTLFTARFLLGGAPAFTETRFDKDVGGLNSPFAYVESEFDGAEEQVKIALVDGNYTLNVLRVNGIEFAVAPIQIVVSAGVVYSEGSPLTSNHTDSGSRRRELRRCRAGR